jgi:hypothetical protein
MGVPDGFGGFACADDLRHSQRLSVFRGLDEAWRVDRLTIIGQGIRGRDGGRISIRPLI